MDERNCELAAKIVSKSYIDQGQDGLRRHTKRIRALLTQNGLPEHPWDDSTIEYLISELSMMDSNNFLGNVGFGEREGRVASDIVSRRHFRLAHGIGRSGDVAAQQPKAAGSSLINKIASYIGLDLLKLGGITRTKAALVVPVATGMAVTLALLWLRQKRRGTKVLWPRMDQKSCLKAVFTAGFEPVVLELSRTGDEMHSDMEKLRHALQDSPDQIFCVLSTTSCFAPRVPDDIVEIAKLCKEFDVPHIINNAYGVQSSKICHQLNEAMRAGRIDVFVQSTDKNFMVPVGGSIIAGPSSAIIEEIARSYPGRASASPLLDLVITGLHLGKSGFTELLRRRKALFPAVKAKVKELAERHGLHLLDTPHNDISIGIGGLECLGGEDCTLLGSMLYHRGVSGVRVVPRGAVKAIGSATFSGYGSHCDDYGEVYLTIACAIGLEEREVDVLLERLDRTLAAFKKQVARGSEESATVE